MTTPLTTQTESKEDVRRQTDGRLRRYRQSGVLQSVYVMGDTHTPHTHTLVQSMGVSER